MSDRLAVIDLLKKLDARRDGSPYMLDDAFFYGLALEALIVIADTLVDIKHELERGR